MMKSEQNEEALIDATKKSWWSYFCCLKKKLK